ncbi:PilZ domain-containing protein [Thalassotalea sp. PS06]|uniref:PilZ domain-containing protein n=1 Tax=Thalassotalea sp. PS06 TaxID=2594005 RepID=UPI0011641326|nr:PilZ domain-containing protein [Thalassotalea sp. PS06]QDP02464.1 PilZ domain-containing protein [Thalassotalea sp. PS06]
MVVERRFHPRYIMQLPVKLKLPGSDELYKANSLNVSLSGMQLAVPQYVTDAIKRYCSIPQELTVSIVADNDESDDSEPLQYPARIIINRRMSSDEYLIGLKFRALSTTHQESLQNLLNRA